MHELTVQTDKYTSVIEKYLQHYHVVDSITFETLYCIARGNIVCNYYCRYFFNNGNSEIYIAYMDIAVSNGNVSEANVFQRIHSSMYA